MVIGGYGWDSQAIESGNHLKVIVGGTHMMRLTPMLAAGGVERL